MKTLHLIIQILCVIFIAWEIFKIFSPKFIWNEVKKRYLRKKAPSSKKIKWIAIIETIYIVFTILLLFSKWWLVGIFIFFLSIVSTIYVMPTITKNESFTPRVSQIIIGDSILSIVLLLFIFIK